MFVVQCEIPDWVKDRKKKKKKLMKKAGEESRKL
jgi:hypothetical protein